MFMQPLLHWKSNNYYKFSQCVCLWPVVSNMEHTCAIVICGLPRSTISFHIISQMAWFSKKKVVELKMCFISTTSAWNISHSMQNWARYDQKTYIGLHVKCLLCLSDFNGNWILLDFPKIPKYKSSQRFIPREPSCSTWTDRHNEPNSHFRNSVSVPKN